jgi:hypothetical protein
MLISILLYNHKQLTECILEVEDIEAIVDVYKRKKNLLHRIDILLIELLKVNNNLLSVDWRARFSLGCSFI